jgi:hypothetical protein
MTPRTTITMAMKKNRARASTPRTNLTLSMLSKSRRDIRLKRVNVNTKNRKAMKTTAMRVKNKNRNLLINKFLPTRMRKNQILRLIMNQRAAAIATNLTHMKRQKMMRKKVRVKISSSKSASKRKKISTSVEIKASSTIIFSYRLAVKS